MKDITIWLIRHSTTEGVEKHWLYGWADLPLTESGVRLVEESRRLGIYPPAKGKDLFSSGLLRATQTLRGIYPDTPFQVDEGFKEMNVGDYECHTHEELLQMPGYEEWLYDATGETACPNGESMKSFTARVCGAFHALAERQQRDAIVVCHGGVIASIMQACFPGEKGFYNWVPAPTRGFAVHMVEDKAVSFTEI